MGVFGFAIRDPLSALHLKGVVQQLEVGKG